MPQGERPFPWLRERGLILEVDGRYVVRKPGPREV